MIQSFKHKGLKKLYSEGEVKGIRSDLLPKVGDILARLDTATGVDELLLVPSFRMHRLAGDMKDYWSVTVKANWRIIFRFANGSAYDVELIDYH